MTALGLAARSARPSGRALWITALLVSLAGALHWVAAAFGVDGLTSLIGRDPQLLRIAYLGVAGAALYAIYGVLRATKQP